jgi:hypothetical protein
LPFVAKIAYTEAHLPVVTTNHLGDGSFLCNSNEGLCVFFQESYCKAIKVEEKMIPQTHISDYTLIAANMVTLHRNFKII